MREKAERALSEAQGAVRDLQTKIGHAELAKNEALETLHRDRESTMQSRAEFEALQANLRTAEGELTEIKHTLEETQELLEEERRARKSAERAQKSAESACEEAERLVQALSEAETTAVPASTPAPVVTKGARSSRGAPKANGDLFAVETPRRGAAEPEPVKWWLNTAPAGKRR
jgi:chromosome segregation ATPase